MHRTIILVDIEGFGDRRRTNPHQVAVRRGLYRILREAFDRSRISWEECDHEDRGDGVFVLAAAPKYLFVDVLPYELAKKIRQHNSHHTEQEQIRLRVAVHAGEVVYDEHGVTGTSINLAFRLLEAAVFKRALATSPGLLAVIVSQWFFEEVVRQSTTSDAGRYRRVTVAHKETRTTGWVHLPDHPTAQLTPVGQLADHDEPIPRQLPPALRDFVGRENHLAVLDALVRAADQPNPGALVIAALTGTAGVGKTTLAVHWAHRIQHRFPDGTLFVNLRGFGPSTPRTPSLVLTSFLRVLGVAERRIPADLDSQVGLYRSLLADRQVLIVLDNAATPEQVRPLLPGAAGCAVLVTSRADLTGLVVAESAHRVPVDLFTEAEATALLHGVIGNDLDTTDPNTVSALIAACARLPLALRVAAARIAARPAGIAEIIDGMTSDQDPLTALSSTGDAHSAVRMVFDWSYARLSADHAQAFRRLGLHLGPRFSVPAAATLAGVDTATMYRQLAYLADMHLVTATGDQHYRMHDLLHAYAAHRAELDEPADVRRKAVTDLLTWYASTAVAADRLIFPGLVHVAVDLAPTGDGPWLADRAQALLWMNTERANLAAALRAAVQHRVYPIAIAIAGTARFLSLRERPLWTLRLEAETLGLVAARAGHDRAAEALLLSFRGDTNADLGQLAAAEADFTAVLAVGRDLGDPRQQRVALAGLGQVRLRQDRYLDARDFFTQALPLAAELGDLRGQAVAHANLSRINVHLGRFGSALTHAERELLLRRQTDDHVGEAYALHDLATARQGLGDHEAAVDLVEQAVALYRALDGTDRYIATALQVAATSLEHTGDLPRAGRCLAEASRILFVHGDPQADLVLEWLHRIEA
ncbi:tetratricopeptide repeat protein [Actinophytocola sediminis]